MFVERAYKMAFSFTYLLFTANTALDHLKGHLGLDRKAAFRKCTKHHCLVQNLPPGWAENCEYDVTFLSEIVPNFLSLP